MQPQTRGHVRTALFVDFDNIYINLRTIDPAAGEAFATQPDRWLRWMQEDMGQVVSDAAEGAGREILVRSCYLNPASFGRFRPFFTHSAFRVVDCPSLTSRGKNSADIHMVLDIIDALAHPTHFDEFILLSADADFTPVMLRLRAHDRRTVLLASGLSSPALQSACDMVLPLEVFLNEALGVNLNEASSPGPARTSRPASAPARDRPAVAAASLPQAVAAPRAQAGTAPPPPHEAAGTERVRQLMRAELVGLVASAQAPVPMASAAQRIRDRLGDAVLQSGWGGYGAFRKFAETVTSDTLQLSGPHPPGYLIDPARHDPLEPEQPRVPLPASVADLAHRVARIVGVPQLAPDAYRVLFDEVARLSADGPVTEPLNAVEPEILAACVARGVRVTRPAVHFVLHGFQLAGVDWQSAGQQASDLAAGFADNVIRLCLNARMELTDGETAQLRSWIAGAA
jgi:NYN domain